MDILKHIGEVDNEIINNAKLVWDWNDTYKLSDYAFVVYDNNNSYLDSLDPITKIYITNSDIYIEHGIGSLGFYKVNRKEVVNKRYKCYVEKKHFSHQQDDGVAEELEWLIERRR